jgi:hypothetical protein
MKLNESQTCATLLDMLLPKLQAPAFRAKNKPVLRNFNH